MFHFSKTLCVAAAVALVAPAFAAEWMTDLEAAKAKAAAEGKAVLVDFTGSDWCGWCIRLKKDVFDKPAFKDYAKDKFVLMEVDVPHNPKFDRKLLERNRSLCEQYKVSGFPTIMVMTPSGEVVGGFVGGMPNLDAARVPLDAALENAAALKAAETMDGEARVKALYAVYEKLPDDLREASGLRERIAELDATNLTGIQDEIKAQAEMEQIVAKLKAAGRDAGAMLNVVNEALEKGSGKNRLMLLELKVGIQLMAAQTEADILAARDTLLQMAEADPENAEAIRTVAEQRFADPARVLQQVKRQRGE